MKAAYSTSFAIAALMAGVEAFSAKQTWTYTSDTSCPNTDSDSSASVTFCEAIENGGDGPAVQWKAYDTCLTADGCTGYNIVLFHLEQVCTELTGPTCIHPTDDDEFKPLLLIPGIFNGAEDWFTGNGIDSFDSTGGTLPVNLYLNCGFDVWIMQHRGSYPSTSNEDEAGQATDATAATRETFFEFTLEDIASEDIPQAISFIQNFREDNLFEELPMNTLGFSTGALI